MTARYDALTKAAEIAEKPALTCEGYNGSVADEGRDPRLAASHSDAHDYCHRSLEIRDASLDLRDSPAAPQEPVGAQEARIAHVDRSKWTPEQRILEITEWLSTDPRIKSISLDAIASLYEVRNALRAAEPQGARAVAWKPDDAALNAIEKQCEEMPEAQALYDLRGAYDALLSERAPQEGAKVAAIIRHIEGDAQLSKVDVLRLTGAIKRIAAPRPDGGEGGGKRGA